jgi:ABC-type lipoprotein export system ATPase subunit
MSSGQRQRCAISSALIRRWEVLLIDEPERHLDQDVVPFVASLLGECTKRGAVLIASHDESLVSVPNTQYYRLGYERLPLARP